MYYSAVFEIKREIPVVMKESADNQSALIAPPKGELYDFLKDEVAFPRRRKHEIFAWATSLLVAIIGVVVALTSINGVTLADR